MERYFDFESIFSRYKDFKTNFKKEKVSEIQEKTEDQHLLPTSETILNNNLTINRTKEIVQETFELDLISAVKDKLNMKSSSGKKSLIIEEEKI